MTSTQIQTDFDRLASYSDDAWNHNHHYHDYLLRHLPTLGTAALDMGCGTGTFARQLAPRFAQVLALDLAPAMIARAQASSQAWPNITYRVANIQTYPLPVAHFDCIATIATLHHLPLAPTLTTLATALKPGGVLLVLDLLQPATWDDFLVGLLAIPVARALHLIKRGLWRPSAAERAAWEAHARTDVYPTLAQVRQASRGLPGAQIRRHLLWRYSLIWVKP